MPTVARLLTGATIALLVVACQAGSPFQQEPRAQPSPSSSRAPTPGPSQSATHDEAGVPEGAGTGRERSSGVGQEALNTRLIEAAWNADLARARRLVRAGGDVNAKDDTEQSAYLISTSEGYLRLLNLTLRHGADVASKDSYNGTGLIRAAERGHADVVGRLLQTDVEVDHVNRLGWTALHEAIILGEDTPRYHDTVRLLAAAGAAISLPSRRDGVLPLQHARSRGFETAATTLRRASRARGLNRSQARALLLRGARRGRADAVVVALRAGAPLEARDDNRRTPLLLAAIHDRVHVARLLVALGADPDRQDFRDDSAWLDTGVTGSVAMLQALLPAHPDLGLENRYGGTSLIPASERGHVDYVGRVVRTDIAVDHVNDLGWTALLEAVILGDGSRRYQRIVRILLRAGADPSIADGDGVTAFEHARARGHEAVARVLRRAAG